GTDEKRSCRKVSLLPKKIGRQGFASFYKTVAREADHPFIVDNLVDFEYMRQIIIDHNKSRLGFGHDVGEVRFDGPPLLIGSYQMNLFVEFAHKVLGYLKIPHV